MRVWVYYYKYEGKNYEGGYMAIKYFITKEKALNEDAIPKLQSNGMYAIVRELSYCDMYYES